MKRMIKVLCAIGIIIFAGAALTMEAHLIKTLEWATIGFVMTVPYLRMHYLEETR